MSLIFSLGSFMEVSRNSISITQPLGIIQKLVEQSWLVIDCCHSCSVAGGNTENPYGSLAPPAFE